MGAYKDGPENIFLQKRTGQKILDGSDWSRQTKTKQKRQKWTSHSYFWPVLIGAGPCSSNLDLEFWPKKKSLVKNIT